MYIDTHAHLNDERLNFKEIIENLAKNGVDYVISVSYDENSCERNFELSQNFDKVFASLGIHPHDAKTVNAELLNKIYKLANSDEQKKIVAYGEIGLDYHYDFSPREKQRQAFCEQLELAHSLKLPIIIHSREAIADTNQILTQNKKFLEFGGVMHCYANGAELVPFYEDLGLYISFTGVITFKNTNKILSSMRTVSKERILTETDCPYMTPEPFRGERNVPQYVKYVAEKMAELRGENLSEFCKQVKLNSNRLFGINTKL